MTSPADFMSRVVVWPGADDAPGWINLHWLSPKGAGMRGRPFKTLHAFMDYARYAATKPAFYKEIFFCTSTQADHGKAYNGKFVAHRHGEKATFFKALWVDVDAGPGKPYPTVAAAIAAVQDFRVKANLPPPSAIVMTGGGIHVYWISNRPLTPAEWRPLAEGLKAEAIRLGLKCDPISADPVRVLRVPGTFNNKTSTPRAVKLVHLGDDYDFSGRLFAHLPTLAPSAPIAKVPVTATATAFALPPEFAAGPSKLFAGLDPADNIASGIGIYDPDVPLDKKEVFRGCFHFQDSFANHGKGQSQGLWMLTTLACTWLAGGREIAHTLSRDYPSYTPDETDRMFDRKLKDRAEKSLGWPACKTFEGEGAKCRSCPYHGRLKSPLNLAERVSLPAQVQVLPPLGAQEHLDLPDNYTLNEKGWICEIVEKEDKNGETSTQYVPMFWCKLRDFRAQSENRQLLFQTSLDMHRWGKAEISEATDLINETSIIKALRQHGVKPNTTISPKRIITFMTSFMARLDASKERQTTLPFGWLREEDKGEMPLGFAYGGRIAMHDGSERASGYSDKQLETFYTPKGRDKPWWDLLHVVTARHHPALECIIAASFAAPLSYATGLYNGIINAWSAGGGAHKSTSMQLGAAVWGSPKLTKEHPGASSKGIIHKMGMIKNLPMFWDEINSPELMKSVASILGSSTQGSGGSKLTSVREFHIYDEWQTLMQVGANLSLVEHIINSKSGTDAQLHRVFEFQVEKRVDTRKHYDIDRLSNALDHNYGHVGTTYSKLLGNNVMRIHDQMTGVLEKFSTEVEVRSEERFRCGIAASVYMGAQLANEIGCNFNTVEIWEFLKDEFLKQRNRIQVSDVVAGSGSNSQNWFSQFLKTFTDNAVWVDTIPSRVQGRPPAVVWLAGVNHLRQRPVHIRLSKSERIIDVSRTKFFEWLVLKEATPSSVLNGLARHFGATEPGRFNLAAGAGVLGGGREPIIRIPVPPNSPWDADLNAHSPPDQQQFSGTGLMPVTATVIPIDKAR